MKNEKCVLSIDRSGGCIVDFHLQGSTINPLNFRMIQEGVYHEPFYYKGHFACLGRWGDPSSGEIKRGLNKHGEFLRLDWDIDQREYHTDMSAFSPLEGLSVQREIRLSESSACYRLTENIRNEERLGRFYQIMQHGTTSNPFLNKDAVMYCNAFRGFDYAHEKYDESVFGTWPRIRNMRGHHMDLSCPRRPYSSVFPFIIHSDEKFGWMALHSPVHHLLLGYVWKREEYPWINHWIHWEKSEGNYTMKYRGMEFGNTGIHKSFSEIWKENLTRLLGEKSMDYLDAGESHSRIFYSFLLHTTEDFLGVGDITFSDDRITVKEKESGKKTIIHHDIK